ncbi:MAG: phospholipase [Bacteroidota bacterium]|jgi:predicted esterase|nr:phospholipase [Bacteroidota bacterium]
MKAPPMISGGLFVCSLMIGRKITITKTARYFLSSEVDQKTEEIWFVCHGYGQLASYFIRNFEVLQNDKTVIVAPEGLHRFYWNGFSGRVVASWMTKEAREDDINDYVNYLNSVYHEVISKAGAEVKVNLLGFSQGTATVCRWIAAGNIKANNLVLWAGAFPDDMDLQLNKKLFDKMNTHLVIGDQDEFIKEDQITNYSDHLHKNGIRYNMIRFSGKHVIDPETLAELASKI